LQWRGRRNVRRRGVVQLDSLALGQSLHSLFNFGSEIDGVLAEMCWLADDGQDIDVALEEDLDSLGEGMEREREWSGVGVGEA
jgi:hypothetical protein